MKREVSSSAMALIALATIFSLTGLLVRDSSCMLSDPVVDVIPPEVCVGQQVLVKAKISVISC